MTYHEQPFSQRFHTLGDIAEGAFEKAAPLGAAIRFGWDRPNVTMRHMSTAIKHLPDYYTGAGYLVEVVGCGRDDTLKFRTSKYEALQQWHRIQPVQVFVYNSSRKEFVLIPWPQFRFVYRAALKDNGGEPAAFENDGNTFVPIAWDRLVAKGIVGAVEDDE